MELWLILRTCYFLESSRIRQYHCSGKRCKVTANVSDPNALSEAQTRGKRQKQVSRSENITKKSKNKELVAQSIERSHEVRGSGFETHPRPLSYAALCDKSPGSWW